MCNKRHLRQGAGGVPDRQLEVQLDCGTLKLALECIKDCDVNLGPVERPIRLVQLHSRTSAPSYNCCRELSPLHALKDDLHSILEGHPCTRAGLATHTSDNYWRSLHIVCKGVCRPAAVHDLAAVPPWLAGAAACNFFGVNYMQGLSQFIFS